MSSDFITGTGALVPLKTISLLWYVNVQYVWYMVLHTNSLMLQTRADATGVADDLNTMCVHEFKTKWTTSDAKAQDFIKRPLPRCEAQLWHCLRLNTDRHVSQGPPPIAFKLHHAGTRQKCTGTMGNDIYAFALC